jgi:hypothetical protein
MAKRDSIGIDSCWRAVGEHIHSVDRRLAEEETGFFTYF